MCWLSCAITSTEEVSWRMAESNQSRMALGTLGLSEGHGVGNPRGIGSGRRSCLLKFNSEIERFLKKKGHRHASLMVTSDRSFRREIAQVSRQFTAFTCSLSWEFPGNKDRLVSETV